MVQCDFDRTEGELSHTHELDEALISLLCAEGSWLATMAVQSGVVAQLLAHLEGGGGGEELTGRVDEVPRRASEWVTSLTEEEEEVSEHSRHL